MKQRGRQKKKRASDEREKDARSKIDYQMRNENGHQQQ